MTNRIPFYRRQLETNFFPYWEKAFDHECGGVYTCYDNGGGSRVSTDKYLWSQGRFLWLASEMLVMVRAGLLSIDEAVLQDMADKTFRFIAEYGLTESDTVHFVTTAEGSPKATDGVTDYSIYADCFALIGFCGYARATGRRSAFALSNMLLTSILRRIDSGAFQTEPYPIAPPFASHSLQMTLTYILTECLTCQTAMGMTYDADIKKRLAASIDNVLDNHWPDTIRDMQTQDEALHDTLLYRHFNPGHTIEYLWFLHDAEEVLLGGVPHLERIGETLLRSVEKGWDSECGGLFRFVDWDGGRPKGILLGDRYEALIANTWDYKLWWPHSELLYTALLLYKKTGDERFAALYERADAYAFATFPNPDEAVGEWIQIRDRRGCPIEKVIALPVKDPFHIMRNLLMAVKLEDL